MRRVLPLALFTTACTLRPWTPSVSVAYWSEPVPPVSAKPLITTSVATERWRLPTDDPWGRYSKTTLLTSLDALDNTSKLPDITQLEVVGEAVSAAHHLAQMPLPNGVLWMLDLRGAASVAFGAALSQRSSSSVSPVLTFNNWPDPEGLVPAEETLAACVQFGPKVQSGAPSEGLERHPVFLLDSWRLAYRDEDVDDETYDNRYALSGSDLPTPQALREAGITRVVYVVESLDDTEKEEDDLNAVFQAYQAQGVALYMVDLAWVQKLSSATDWSKAIVHRSYWVQNRVTIVQSPWFYTRFRGGFGGFRARPLHLTGGSGGRGGRSLGSGRGGGG